MRPADIADIQDAIRPRVLILNLMVFLEEEVIVVMYSMTASGDRTFKELRNPFKLAVMVGWSLIVPSPRNAPELDH
jgi:hypothetical protein